MNISTFIMAWFVAVAGMTLFSALWSQFTKNEFREPQLLSQILDKHPTKSSRNSKFYTLGWLIHFFLGAVFLVFYEILWRITGVERTLLWSLVFGSVLGIIGIIGWKLMFSGTNFSPRFKYAHYYVHLFFAHLVFSVMALLVYHWFN